MLNRLCDSWNRQYPLRGCGMGKATPVAVEKSRLVLEEEVNKDHGFRELTLDIAQAVDFHSKELEGFDFRGSLCGKNCDGAYLVSNGDGSCDLVLIELKSNFDTDKLYEAKKQIVNTLIKLNVLLSANRAFHTCSIRRTYGIIVSIEPDSNTKNWLRQMMSSDEKSLGNRALGVELYRKGKKAVGCGMPEFDTSVAPEEFVIYYLPSPKETARVSLANDCPRLVKES